MKKMMLATAFIILGTFAACDATDEPDEVNVTVEEPDTLSDKIEETGDAIEDSAEEDAEAAVNDAGEAMKESTDTPQ
ncbi:hypothetical protein [Hyphomonas sp.]|jgi:hypothetical protein|uniref:hypothetical protein n=1 Tax=Hyphomonas sp. TaxID=87 RepID=UPI0032D8E14D